MATSCSIHQSAALVEPLEVHLQISPFFEHSSSLQDHSLLERLWSACLLPVPPTSPALFDIPAVPWDGEGKGEFGSG